MKTTMRSVALAGLAGLWLLTGCSGGSGGDGGGGIGAKVVGLKMLDAGKKALGNATLCEVDDIPDLCGDCISDSVGSDGDGVVQVEVLGGKFKFTKAGSSGCSEFALDGQDEVQDLEIITPLACDDEGENCTDISGEAIIATITGTVMPDVSSLSAAQLRSKNTSPGNIEVSISGGGQTGGAFATAITDAQGRYTLLINLGPTGTDNNNNPVFPSNFTITLRGDNIRTTTQSYNLRSGIFTGNDYTPPAGSDEGEIVFRETFGTSSPTAAQWQVANQRGDVGWRFLTTGQSVTNQAAPEFVTLPPDEAFGGRVPDPPVDGRAYYYGSASGNFLGQQAQGDDAKSGGTSTEPNSGTLTSPAIDLSGVPAGTPVSLGFRSFWEIESVNPNCDGFDLMTVQLAIGSGPFVDLARLNPLSDPQTGGLDRDPLPFSNRGFNAGPRWLQQEAIPLPDVAGQSIRLRFVFDTVDELFNGFRGWAIDEVIVRSGVAGSFPLIDETDCDFGGGDFAF